MGQKTHPTGFRVGIIQPWFSTWFGNKREYAQFVAEDAQIRKFVKSKLYNAGVARILISRKEGKSVAITIITAKSGIVVGKGGAGIDELRNEVSKLINKPVVIDVVEVARVDIEAQLVSESIALQLEKRVTFRKAMKQAMQRTMRAGAQGVKVMVSGRLGGNEIARSEWAKEGRIPLQTLRANIDYGFAEADTIMGKIGVKVWIYKGNVERGDVIDQNIKIKKSPVVGEEKPVGVRRKKRASQPKAQTVETPSESENN